MENDSAPKTGDVACFFDVNVDDAKPPEFYVRDEFVNPLVSRLESRQMVVLGGRRLEDKRIFAKHLAWNLAAKNGQPIPIKQWCPGLARQDVGEALRQVTGETILLFSDVHPHRLGRGLLRRLHAAVRQHDEEGRRHYAIVTTDTELADWGGEALEKFLWHDELETGDIYSPELLSYRLGYALRGCEALREAGRSIEDLARELRTPARVRGFADLVKEHRKPIEPGWIERIMQQLSGEEAAVRDWFDYLTRRLRTLALGLALLDGLFRDQALAVLDILVIEVWRQRQPQLPCFAASELPLLGAFFRGTSEGDQAAQITCLSAKHREAILRAAWNWDQNLVREALPVLATIAAWSGSFGGPAGLARDGGEPGDDERDEAPFADRIHPGYEPRLFGTPERVRQIQWTVSVTLSEIGKRISFAVVKNVLLVQLAANQEPDLHRRAAAHCVAAAALALWRERAGEEKDVIEKRENLLFDTLERLFGEPGESVKATVALSVGYAARFDQPHALSSRLLILFKELCRNEAPLVWELARLHMVPTVAELHLSQVELFLREEVARGEGNEVQTRFGLALGLAAACSFQPTVSVPVLERWYREGLKAFRHSPAAKNRLIAAVLAYGWIAADDLGGMELQVAEISRRLRKAINRDKAVRESVADALKIQLSREPEKVLPVFGALLRRLTQQELGSMAELSKALHLQELEKQKDFCLVANPDHKRDLTRIESAMEPWLLERRCTAAGRLAVRTLLAISALRHEVDRRERLAERELIAELDRKGRTRFGRFVVFITKGRDPIAAHRARRKSAEERETTLRSQPSSDWFLTPVFFRLAVFWATILSPRYRVVVQAQFAELLDYWQSSVSILREPRKWLARIFDRYEGRSVDLEPIVGHLVRSVWLFRYRWPAVLVSGILLASLVVNLYAR